MLKKIFAILLLCCLLLNIIGYHIIFCIRHSEIKAEMKRLLRLHANNEEQEVFAFSLNDKKALEKLEWESDDEFNLNGEMYDVIDKKILDGKLLIRCISDKKETALLKKYEKINNENNSKNKSALLLKLVSSSYISSTNTNAIIKNIPVATKVSFQSEIISSSHHEVLTPPPQVS